MAYNLGHHQADMTKRFNECVSKLERKLENIPTPELKQIKDSTCWYHKALWLMIGLYGDKIAEYTVATNILGKRQSP